MFVFGSIHLIFFSAESLEVYYKYKNLYFFWTYQNNSIKHLKREKFFNHSNSKG